MKVKKILFSEKNHWRKIGGDVSNRRVRHHRLNNNNKKVFSVASASGEVEKLMRSTKTALLLLLYRHLYRRHGGCFFVLFTTHMLQFWIIQKSVRKEQTTTTKTKKEASYTKSTTISPLPQHQLSAPSFPLSLSRLLSFLKLNKKKLQKKLTNISRLIIIVCGLKFILKQNINK